MASSRNHLGKAGQGSLVHPAARFMTDFARLLTDVDQLMLDVRSAVEKEYEPVKPNGNGRKLTLNGTSSRLREHAEAFNKSIRQFDHLPQSENGTAMKRNEHLVLMNELMVNLSGAANLKAVGDSIVSYCRKAF